MAGFHPIGIELPGRRLTERRQAPLEGSGRCSSRNSQLTLSHSTPFCRLHIRGDKCFISQSMRSLVPNEALKSGSYIRDETPVHDTVGVLHNTVQDLGVLFTAI